MITVKELQNWLTSIPEDAIVMFKDTPDGIELVAATLPVLVSTEIV